MSRLVRGVGGDGIEIENARLKSACSRTARQDVDAPKISSSGRQAINDAPQPCAESGGVSWRAAAAAHRSSMHFDGSLSASKGQGRPPLNRADCRGDVSQDTRRIHRSVYQKWKTKRYICLSMFLLRVCCTIMLERLERQRVELPLSEGTRGRGCQLG